MIKKYFLLLSVAILMPALTWAEAQSCMDKKISLDFNESQVLVWRDEQPHKFKARAYIKGRLVQLIEDRQRHVHFEVDLDEDLSTSDDRIEVIFNTGFGPIPAYQPGDEVIACGDFVVDNYSPHRAVIHWLHMSPKKNNHDHGFIIINGVKAGHKISETGKE